VNGRRALTILWGVLTRAQRRRCVLLQFVSLLMAMSTVLGLAAVMSFLAVLADPTLIESQAVLGRVWRLLDMPMDQFIVALGAGFILLLISSALVNLAGSRAFGRFAYSVGDRLRELLFAGYLRRDYLFHARAGSGRLMDNVLNQADRVTITLLQGLQLLTNAALSLLVIVSIAIVNPTVALVGVVAIGGSYFLFYRIIRWRVSRHGRVQAQQGAERIAIVEQAFLGIKYLLIARAQPLFNRRFGAATRALSHSYADTQFIGQFPKYVLECVAGAALIACAALVRGGSMSGVWLAQLSFIGFAGFRLLPAFQQMYQAFVVIRSNRHAIENVASELEAGVELAQMQDAGPDMAESSRVGAIELVDVSFRYSAETPLVLRNASLRIPAGAAIGIVGASGCGKTTLADLLLGLLQPTGGRIEIDGVRAVGYVPQEVMILDASVRENIAFGVDPERIDDARVREVAREAGASGFLEALPRGYFERISAAGTLSGGQRQRIGIARALYHDPTLLVLDEATNSLDADTEQAIIETVVRNRGGRTLVIIAHGAALIDACDCVYELRDGVLQERGSQAVRQRLSVVAPLIGSVTRARRNFE